MSATTQNQTEISNLSREIKRGTRVISLSSLTSISAKAYILHQLQLETKNTFVIIADSNRELETWENDIEFWVQSSEFSVKSAIPNPKSQIETLPSFEVDIYSAISPHAETLERRALALWNLSENLPNFILTSA